MDGARARYARALDIIERLQESNLWIEATAATAALVTGDDDAARRHLAAIADHRPTPENRETIERGLRRCAYCLGLDGTRVEDLLAMLR